MSAEQATEDDLGQQVRTGLAWSLLNNLAGRIGTLAIGILLARVLQPKDYGVFAVALVCVGLLLSVNDAGLPAALVRWQGPFEEVGPTALTLTLALSAFLYALVFFGAPTFCSLLNAPEATGVVRLMTTTVLIDAVFSMPAVQVTRALLQRRRTAADLLNLTVSSAVSVALALSSHGAWSLAWGRIAGNTVSGVVLMLAAPAVILPGFDRAKARSLLAFGAPLIGSNIVVFLMLNIDNVIVSRILGPVTLGYYALAFNLSSWPVSMFAFAARRVSLAGFSRLVDDPPLMLAAFRRGLSLLVAVALPVCVLLAVLAKPAIEVVYGPKWSPAAAALVWLALLALVRVATELTYDLVLASGRPGTVLGLQVLWVAVLVPALCLGALTAGIAGVAVAHLAVGAVVVVPAFTYVVNRCGLRPGQLYKALARPLFAGAVTAVAVFGMSRLLPTALTELLVGGLVGLTVYAAIVAPMRELVSSPLQPSSN